MHKQYKQYIAPITVLTCLLLPLDVLYIPDIWFSTWEPEEPPSPSYTIQSDCSSTPFFSIALLWQTFNANLYSRVSTIRVRSQPGQHLQASYNSCNRRWKSGCSSIHPGAATKTGRIACLFELWPNSCSGGRGGLVVARKFPEKSGRFIFRKWAGSSRSVCAVKEVIVPPNPFLSPSFSFSLEWIWNWASGFVQPWWNSDNTTTCTHVNHKWFFLKPPQNLHKSKPQLHNNSAYLAKKLCSTEVVIWLVVMPKIMQDLFKCVPPLMV